jgi:uncharacterized protein (DUF2062 family)
MVESVASLRRSGLRWLGRLLRVRDTPEALARGLAVGLFFGVSIFWGLQIVLAVLASHLLRGNKLIAGAMTAVSNPFTTLPLYGLCYVIGHFLVGGREPMPDLSEVASLDGILALGPRFLVTMLVGTTLVGFVGAVALYLSSHRILAALRRWHHKRAPETGSGY